MKKSRTYTTAFATITDFILQIVSTIFPFFLRSLFIQRIGSDFLGLNGLCTSVLGTLNIVEFGIDASVKYRLYKPVSERDWVSTSNLLNYIRKIYVLMGIFVLCFAIILMPFLPKLIKSDIPNDVNIYFVFSCYLLQILLSYWFFNFYQTLFLADLKKSTVDLIRTIVFIFVYSIQFVFVYFRHYYLYVVCQILFSFLFGLVLTVKVRSEYKDVHLTGDITHDDKVFIWKDTLSVAVFKIRTISRTVFDNSIISAMLGLVVLSNYNNYTMVSIVPSMFSAIISTALAPSIGNFQVSESKEQVYHIFTLTFLLQLCVICITTVCFYEMIQSFILIWLGKDFLLSKSFVIVITLQIFFSGISAYLTMIRESLNLWKKGKIFAGIEIALNLVLNILLTKLFGLPGIVLATVITIMFLNIPVDLYGIVKDHFEASPLWFVVVLFLCILCCTISIVFIELIMKYIPDIHIWTLLVRVAITVFVSCIVLFILFIPFRTFRELLAIVNNFFKGLFCIKKD